MQDYFNCIVHFFKELAVVKGQFHDNYGWTLNQVVIKALRCMSMMAQIGSIGSFDFSKSFVQRNCLRTLLQAKVVDSKFLMEFDVWRLNRKPDQNPFHHSLSEAR